MGPGYFLGPCRTPSLPEPLSRRQKLVLGAWGLGGLLLIS